MKADLESSYLETNNSVLLKNSFFLKNQRTTKTIFVKIEVVRSPGFEPGIAGLEGLHQMSVSYQARPQPHIKLTAI